MSDNVIPGPRIWLENARFSLDAVATDESTPLVGGGGPPHDGGMEARIAIVEMRMDRIEGKLDSVDTRLRGVDIKLAEIGGKLDLLVSKIPSWWQAPVSAAGLLALLLAALGLAQHFGLIVAR
jgi:hypothetical protein